MTDKDQITPITLSITKKELKHAIFLACMKMNHTVEQSFLNQTTKSEKLDEMIRDEICLKKLMSFLDDHGRYVLDYNRLRVDYFLCKSPNWQLIVFRNERSASRYLEKIYQENEYSYEIQNEDITPNKGKTFSIEAYHEPDIKIKELATRKDFKITKCSESVEQDFKSEFLVNGYLLGDKHNSKEDRVVSESTIDNVDFDSILDRLKLTDRYRKCVFPCFISRQKFTEVNRSQDANNRTCVISKTEDKEMWRVPLSDGKSFDFLVG